MEEIILNGANIDNRPKEVTDGDYTVDEIAAGSPIEPFKHDKPTKVGATLYSQEYVGSCVPHGFITQLEYEGIIPAGGLSQLRAYRKRSNYPEPGSIAVDIYTKIKSGQNRNSDAPTTLGMTESMATAMPYVLGEKLIKDFNYFDYKGLYSNVPYDVANGKAVAVFIYATKEEWSQEYVEIIDPNLNPSTAYVRHCVCLMPNGDFTENGKRWLAVHDSAKFGGRHLRYISYEFLLARTFYASKVYAKDTTPLPPPVFEKPTVACKFGESNQNVKNLQAFLVGGKYLEPQYISGNYGALTAKAVLWFQLFNHDKFISTIPDLLKLGGKYWGEQSIAIIK